MNCIPHVATGNGSAALVDVKGPQTVRSLCETSRVDLRPTQQFDGEGGIEESEKPLTPTNALMRTAISYTHEVNRVPSTAIARSDLGEVMRCGEKDTALVNDHLLQNEVGRELEVHLVAHWDSNNKKNIQIKRIYIKIP